MTRRRVPGKVLFMSSSHSPRTDATGRRRGWRLSTWAGNGISWVTSLLVHMVLLIILGLWVLPRQGGDGFSQLLAITDDAQEEPIVEFRREPVDTAGAAREAFESIPPVDAGWGGPPVDDLQPALAARQPMALRDTTAPTRGLLELVGSGRGSELEGRSAGERASLVEKRGGTVASEQAVARALDWFARHQQRDGSWSLDHQVGPCRGRCPNPGKQGPALNAATALALLPFLGAGHTHLRGDYAENVAAGLRFLLRSMKSTGEVGSFYEPGGFMYSHGLVSIALCEAYGMTHDKKLLHPAQRALNFIAQAQDPVGGGWRYWPRQPGDTSVFGWQLMALKSGQMAYLKVKPSTIRKATLFLDSVQQEDGTFYGYTVPGRTRRLGTTAIGLLCRMYMGWPRDLPALARGVQWISARGPSKYDFYANYYATQVLFQFSTGTGQMWNDWNNALRDQLVASQATDGHQAGSWYLEASRDNRLPPQPLARPGGRHIRGERDDERDDERADERVGERVGQRVGERVGERADERVGQRVGERDDEQDDDQQNEQDDVGRANPEGGRLYCTALATMILEVYYRHMPIYAKNAVEEDFPD